MKSSKIRAFLAVDVHEDLSKKILKVQDEFKDLDARIKFVEPENMHLTLKFFGDITQYKVEQINQIVARELRNADKFTLNLKSIGAFPSINKPKTLWIRTDKNRAFTNIQRRCDIGLEKVGFKREKKYNPHLTFGRVKDSKSNEQIINKLNELNNIIIGEMLVDEVVLKSSELTPSGPIYTDLKTFKLGTIKHRRTIISDENTKSDNVPLGNE